MDLCPDIHTYDHLVFTAPRTSNQTTRRSAINQYEHREWQGQATAQCASNTTPRESSDKPLLMCCARPGGKVGAKASGKIRIHSGEMSDPLTSTLNTHAS